MWDEKNVTVAFLDYYCAVSVEALFYAISTT